MPETTMTNLTETTLNRIRSHFTGDRAVAMISAFHKDFEYEENVERKKELASIISRKGYGYVDEEKEDSIIVIGGNKDSGRLKKLMLDQMKKYEQEAVLFKPENKENISLLYRNGVVEKLGKNFFESYGDYIKQKNQGKMSICNVPRFYFAIRPHQTFSISFDGDGGGDDFD